LVALLLAILALPGPAAAKDHSLRDLGNFPDIKVDGLHRWVAQFLLRNGYGLVPFLHGGFREHQWRFGEHLLGDHLPGRALSG